MKIIKIFVLLAFMFTSSIAFAEELNLSLDKNVLSEGDVLSLSIEYNGDEKGNPDLSSLEDDFQIVSNSTSTQVNYINGTFSQTKKWTVGLRPLKKGKIVIKPIKFAGLTSNYQEVEVKELTDVAYIPDSKTNYNSPYFKIEQKTEKGPIYIHQQMNVLVTIYDSLGLKDGAISISEDTKNNWIIKPLFQQPKVTQEVIDGRKMNVVKFWYAMFPQKSGELVVPEFSFNGYYIKNTDFGLNNFHNDFMMLGVDFRSAFGQRVPVLMKTKKKVVNILPNIQGSLLKDWLVLDDLSVSSSLSVKNGFKVGEAFSQNIEIRAVGTEKNLMPNLVIPEVDGLNQYPEKPEFREEIVKGKVVTTAIYNIVYIPSKGGEFIIPKIDINWFDVNTKTMKTSSVDEEKIVVFSSQENNDIENITTNSNKTKEKQEEKVTDIKETPKQSQVDFTYRDLIWLLVVVFILVGFIIFRKTDKNKGSSKYYKNEVIKALNKYDYKQVKYNLIEWARIKFDDDNIRNFKDIASCVKNPQFEKQLDILNKLLYSKVDELFDSTEFVKELKKVDKMKTKKGKKNDILPNLYD